MAPPSYAGPGAPVGTKERSRYVAIVQQGNEKVFRILQARFGHEEIEVTWDRRVRSRRSRYQGKIPERRRRERRAGAPITWTALGFLLLRAPRAPSEDPERAALRAAVDALRLFSDRLAEATERMKRVFERASQDPAWRDPL